MILEYPGYCSTCFARVDWDTAPMMEKDHRIYRACPHCHQELQLAIVQSGEEDRHE